MKANFKLQNVAGTVYRQGNLVFTPDGNSIVSPVGNRVSVFDLVNNKSRTLPFENRKNIASIALSPDGNVLLSVDEDGRAVLANFRRGAVLHHMNFKRPVNAAQFSPDGKYIAISHGQQVQVWNTPSHLVREFAPFVLHRVYTGHHDEVTSITWSRSSRFFLTTSKDLTAKLFTLNPLEGFKPKTFAGHKDQVIAAYFSADERSIYTLSRDGAVFTWTAKQSADEEDDDMQVDIIDAPESSTAAAENLIGYTRWGIAKRDYFNQAHTNTVATAFHARTSMLIVGFSSGVFGLWEMPSFTNIHTLSISQDRIASVAVNASGEWLAFGASELGQLLVWEWQSESYVLKQQGHFYDMNTLAFSQDGQNIATGGEDSKVKVWSADSGYCFVTFTDHSASVTAVEFAKRGQILFSASLDGTVRAYDLVRYRNFRTFTSPTPVQFASLAVDPSGEVVCAGSQDNFEIYMWSVQTGKLLDVLSGHEAPVVSLAFSPTGNQLASASWDRSVRLWSVFGRSRSTEPLQLSTEALAVAYRPDGKELAVASLDGQITMFDVNESKQTGVIEGRKDISGGRLADDRMSAANNAASKHFNSIAYTADGSCLLAGGSSKYVAIYDLKDGVMVKKFQVSENLSMDGTQEFLDSRRMTEAGAVDLLDLRGQEEYLADRLDSSLPGAQRGDLSKRKSRRAIRTTCVRFAPTGRAWAAASTEGLLLYGLDELSNFDPLDLDMDITPEACRESLKDGDYLLALVIALRINEESLLVEVFERIPRSLIHLLARQIPEVYVASVLQLLVKHMERAPHIEFDLLWSSAMLAAHGRTLSTQSVRFASVLRGLQKGLNGFESDVTNRCDENAFAISYVLSQ